MMELSIIVPVYNGEKYLAELLDSICSIKDISVEILLVNDGSLDGSEKIIRSYQERDGRIRYLKKENGGIVSARNYGLQAAEGEYLFFADQDDILDAGVLETAIKKSKAANADMALFSTKCFNDNGKSWDCDTVWKAGHFNEREVSDIFIRKLITRYAGAEGEIVSYIGHIWAAVIRRSLVKEHGIVFKRFMAIEDDLLFVLDTLNYAGSVITMTEAGYYWRQNPDSRTRRGKYSVEHASKMRKYYEYRTDILVKHGICTAEELQAYYTGVRQEFILNLLDNEAMWGHHKIIKACRLLQRYIKDEEMKAALADEPRCPLAQRYTVEKRLLAGNRVYAAVLYKKVRYLKAIVGNKLKKYQFERKRRRNCA